MTYYPPAYSKFDLAPAVRAFGDRPPLLHTALQELYRAEGVVTASSWVLLLARLLAHLAENDPAGRREIVLARYSCNEFTKAIVVAGLVPIYHDLNDRLECPSEAVEAVVTERTLGVITINNCGVDAGSERVRRLCDRLGVWNIEDATYTYLGADATGRLFGSFGHFAIFNFSEGKIIPVGGGAVVFNGGADAGARVFTALTNEIDARSPKPKWKELAGLIAYRGGSSLLGYNAYRRLRALTGTDLKQLLSMEPTRAREAGFDLVRAAGKAITVAPERREELLAQSLTIQPLNAVKSAVGEWTLRHRERIRDDRQARYADLRAILKDHPRLEFFDLPPAGMPIKAPFVYTGELTAARIARWDALGVYKQYLSSYPTNGHPAFPNANRYYDRLYTIPVHAHMTKAAYAKIRAAL